MSEKRKGDFQNRKFQDSWTDKYCFINHNDSVTCLICSFKIAVAKEYNVRRHYETKHNYFASLKGHERSFKIEQLKKSFSSQTNFFQKRSFELDSYVEVSLGVAEIIAKEGRQFTDGDFVKKCLLLASEKICPEAKRKFENVSLNRMTIQRRIEQLNENIENQVKSSASNFEYFSLAVDESTDRTSIAQLLVFVRGIDKNFCVMEELLGMFPMKGQTTGSELLSSLLYLCDTASLNMNNCVSITTDGAKSMTGTKIGMVTLLKQHLAQFDVELLQFHCIIHQENLCGKELGFSNLMQCVSEAINFIRSNALKHREFKEFLKEFDDLPSDVLYYTEVRWLSRGVALKRFMELFDEIVTFLSDHGRNTRRLKEPSFQCDLAFLTDITSHLNDLNTKLQGKNQLIFQLINNVKAFKKKLCLFQDHLKTKNFAHFPYCQKMHKKFPDMKMQYADQIQILRKAFEDRFSDFEKCQTKIDVFSSPFSVNVNLVDESMQLALIDLQNSDICKNQFKEKPILEFYKDLPDDEFSCLKQNAAACATFFGSTYICEQTFSLMNLNKSKTRNRITDENLSSILRIATTNLKPNIKSITSNIQSQPSH